VELIINKYLEPCKKVFIFYFVVKTFIFIDLSIYFKGTICKIFGLKYV